MTPTRRPATFLLTEAQVEGIVKQAFLVLGKVGVFVENDEALALLQGAGQRIDQGRVFLTEEAVRNALSGAPSRVVVGDREGTPVLELSEDKVHFDPGSAALHFLDPRTRRRRKPVVQDCIHLAWVAQACKHMHAQSTGLIPTDVPEVVQDRYRLYVALRHCTKPVVTGMFLTDAYGVMKDMLVAVRGDEEALRRRPLAIFDCAPTPPLKWSDLTCQALVDCARSGIPAQLVSMPMAGATSPVTLREVVLQHCVENLSGIVIHQLAGRGSPVLWGGCPTAFDMRHGTTAMGAIETMMIDMACSQVGKSLNLPTHAYMGLSDSKVVGWQAGAESGIGAVLAALAGINLVSGPGMVDFSSCQSLEKLVLDNEACGMALRLARGLGAGSEAEAPALLQAVVETGHFLAHPHTRANFRSELLIPGRVVDRGSYADWEKEGGLDSAARAAQEVERILAKGNTSPLPGDASRELDRLIQAEASRCGLEPLPVV